MFKERIKETKPELVDIFFIGNNTQPGDNYILMPFTDKKHYIQEQMDELQGDWKEFKKQYGIE